MLRSAWPSWSPPPCWSRPHGRRSRPGRHRARPRIAAVGDIACKDPPKRNKQVCQYDDVAAAIERGNYDRFLVLGDVQYETGKYQRLRRQLRRLLPRSAADHRARAWQSRLRYGGRHRLLPLLRDPGPRPERLLLLRPRRVAHHRAQLGDLPGGGRLRTGRSAVRVAAAGPRERQRRVHLGVLASPALRLAEVPERKLDGGLRVPPDEAVLGSAVGRRCGRRAERPQPQLLAMEADGCERRGRRDRDPAVHRGLGRSQPEQPGVGQHQARHVREGVGRRLRVPGDDAAPGPATTGGSCRPTASSTSWIRAARAATESEQRAQGPDHRVAVRRRA